MKKTVLDYILKVRLPVTLFVILISFAVTYYVSRPERDGIGYQPEQPIKFSHKLHAGTMAIDCKYCHIGTEKSRYAVIPSVNICMNCHSAARKNSPEIIKLTKYYNQGIPVPWKRIHRLPDYVYFNHSVHVNKGIDCFNCHGIIKNMDVVQQIKSFTMASCLDCHKNIHKYLPNLTAINNGPTNCFACHR
jgi:hypothetical protein